MGLPGKQLQRCSGGSDWSLLSAGAALSGAEHTHCLTATVSRQKATSPALPAGRNLFPESCTHLWRWFLIPDATACVWLPTAFL
jgi:hypothetical protein